MSEALRHAAAAVMGLGAGMVISGAVFAFITIVGVVPRMAQKTKTGRHIKYYESAIVLGGISGTLAGLFAPTFALGPIIGGGVSLVLGLLIGVFYGALVMSLAETLDVIPILCRRARLQRGMFWFVLAIALGKLAGALLYALVPGFHDL